MLYAFHDIGEYIYIYFFLKKGATSLQTPSAMFSLKGKVNNLVNMDIFGHICATSTATGQEICLECSESAFCLRPLAGRMQQMWFCEGRCSPLSSRWLHHHTGSGLAPTLTLGRQARTVAGTLNFQCNLNALVGVILELSDDCWMRWILFFSRLLFVMVKTLLIQMPKRYRGTRC